MVYVCERVCVNVCSVGSEATFWQEECNQF